MHLRSTWSPRRALHEMRVRRVGAGIGVTPFASILKDVRHKVDALNKVDLDADTLQELLDALGMVSGATRATGSGSTSGSTLYSSPSRSTASLKKLYFFWTTRSQGAFQWFGDLLTTLSSVETPVVAARSQSLGSSSRSPLPSSTQESARPVPAPKARPWEIEISTFITGTKVNEQKDLGSLFLQMGLDLVLESTGVALLTGHNLGTRFERPDWDAIFGRVAAAHPGLSIGVFFCGPERLGATLREKCESFTKASNDATRFSFHTEVF